MKKYNLLVVGNGFDLHLGYKTKYTHFCDYLIHYCQPIDNKLFYFFYHAYDYGYLFNDDWTSFEQLLCQYLEFINYLFTKGNAIFSYTERDFGLGFAYAPYLILENINKLPINCLRVLDISNPLEDYIDYYWFDADDKKHIMDTRLSSFPSGINKIMIKLRREYKVTPSLDDFKREVVKNLNDLINDVEEQLAKYIKRVTSQQLPKSYFLSNVFGNEVDKILSFNYSHTSQEMFKLTDLDVAFVHGDVNHQIVIGVEEKMIENQTISESTSMFTPFFKKSRRFIKKCNEHFKDKILDSITPESELAIFGHSLDKSDRSIFEQIFNCDFKHCDIYYYGDETKYRVKLIELIGIDKIQELNNGGKISFIAIE